MGVLSMPLCLKKIKLHQSFRDGYEINFNNPVRVQNSERVVF